MQLALLLALMQVAAPPIKFAPTPIYERALDDTSKVSIVAGENDRQSGLQIRLLIRGRSQRVMASLIDPHLITYRVLRADDTSIVIRRAGLYTIENSVKLFINPQKRTVVKQIDYAPDIGLGAVDEKEVARVLDVPPALLKRLQEKPLNLHGAGDDLSYLPKDLQDHPMPESTYPEFARLRRRRAQDGYGANGTIIKEAPGPYQIVGPRIWFGKIFYDGEGTTGVGGVGYLDTATSKYSFLRVPMLADWSVSALLIEDQEAWMGLVEYPEGAPYPGGLLHYNFRSGVSRKFPTEEVVRQIVRWNDRVYVSTTNGAYQIREGVLKSRYRVEPNIDNRFIIITESLSARPQEGS